MPQVGYQPISPGGVVDLYSPYAQMQQNAEQLKLQKQQHQWGQIKDALPILMKVFQAIQANKQLESMGVKTQVPEQKQFDEPTLNQFMKNMGQFSPEAQAQLKGMAQEGHTYPTGKMKTEYDWSKLPAGAKYEDIMTGMSYEGQKPQSGITEIPEGFEVTGYTADGRQMVRKVKEEKKADITLSQALGILSDSQKASQLKRTYPKIYERAEQIVKEQLGEEALSKVSSGKISKSKKTAEETVTEDLMDTDWGL